MRPEDSTTIFVADTVHLNNTTIDPCTNLNYSLLQLHAKHRMSSLTSNQCDAAKPYPKTQQKCSICDDIADGWHFNSLSCSACSAFFRRSVAEQKIYTCVPRTCNVSIYHRKNGIICKYCRFTRCVVSGMRTEEVQGKRMKPDRNKMKEEGMIQIKLESLNGSSSPEQSTDSQSNSNSSNSNSTPRRRSHPMTIVRNRVGIGSSKCPLLNSICSKRRLIESRRSNSYQLRSLRNANGFDLKQCTQVEMDLFASFLKSFPFDSNKLTSYYDGFIGWLLFECVLSTLRLGGPQTSQIFLPSLCFFDTFDQAVYALIHSQMPSHAIALTRLSLPVVKFFLESVCRPIQFQHFDELEIAAIETLLIAKCMTDKNEATELQRRTFNELFLHYTGAEDDGVRFGQLILCLSAINDLKIQVHELALCFQLI